MNRIAGNAALAIASTVVGVLIGECVLAFLPAASPLRPYRSRLDDPNLVAEPYLREAPDAPYTPLPGYTGAWRPWEDGEGEITIDSRGFRVARELRDRAPLPGVLCMGDSFTFGYLVDDHDTYPDLLDRLYGGERRVMNAGYYGGFSFDGAALRYRAHLAGLRPRVVLYGVFPNNDFSDLSVWTRIGPDGGPAQLRTVPQILNKSGYSVPLLRESRVFVGLARLWSRWQYRGLLEQTQDLVWTRARDAVRRFHSATDSSDSRLVFVFLREANDVAVRDWTIRAGGDVDAVARELDQNIRRFKSILDAEHVEWHDDEELLKGLRSGLAAHRLPRAPQRLEPAGLEARAARAGWSRSALAATDGVHYSHLTNAYVASWIYRLLEGREAAP